LEVPREQWGALREGSAARRDSAGRPEARPDSALRAGLEVPREQWGALREESAARRDSAGRPEARRESAPAEA
jgi:hypothetical protein